jgi:hypothetical protein
MRALSVPELLDVWDRSFSQPPVGRALALLAAACPDYSQEELAFLSIGQRDARLLTLREWTFGSEVASLVSCPHCRETVEVNFSVSDVRVDGASVEPATRSPAVQRPESSLTVAGYEVEFRPPHSDDLASIAANPAASPRRILFERCLIAARRDGAPVEAAQLPDEVVSAVAQRLAEDDPQAVVRLNVLCPFCGTQSSVVFDIASFFWTEINAWARRIMREVHLLARAYGWSERDILALSPRRRHLYLEMAAA